MIVDIREYFMDKLTREMMPGERNLTVHMVVVVFYDLQLFRKEGNFSDTGAGEGAQVSLPKVG